MGDARIVEGGLCTWAIHRGKRLAIPLNQVLSAVDFRLLGGLDEGLCAKL